MYSKENQCPFYKTHFLQHVLFVCVIVYVVDVYKLTSRPHQQVNTFHAYTLILVMHTNYGVVNKYDRDWLNEHKITCF